MSTTLLVYSLLATNILSDAMVPLSIASFIEVSLGCICASLATLRPFIQRFLIRSQKGRSFTAGTGPDGSNFPASHSYDSAQKSWNLQEIVEIDEETAGLRAERSRSRAV